MPYRFFKTLGDYLKWDMHHVPLLRCAIPFAIGIALSGIVTTDMFLPAMLSLAVSLVLFIVGLNKFSRSVNVLSDIAIVCALLLTGLAYCQIRRNADPIGDNGDRCQIKGYVYDIYREADDELKVIVTADTLTTYHHVFYDVRGLLTFEGDSLHFIPGERIVARGRLRKQYSRLFSTFDYMSFLYEKNLQYEAEIDDIEKIGSEGWSYSSALGRIRNGVYDRLLMSGVDSTNVGFIMALVMGDKSRLPRSLKNEFSNCGLIHLIAVSGLHIGIIYCLLTAMISRFVRKRKWYVSVFIIVVLWIYSAICGFSPSSLRAVVMMSVIELSQLTKRQSEIGSTLCAAAFIVLLIDPINIYSLGFWLSFSAVGGIMSFYAILNQFDPFKNKLLSRYIYSAICVSVVAQVGTMPISLYYFHRFPTYFLINNLVVINFIFPIVGWSILSILLAHVIGLGCVLNYAVDALKWYISLASSWPYSSITDIPFTLCDCILVIIALYTLAWLFRQGVAPMNGKNMHKLFVLSLSMFLVSWSYTIYSVRNRHCLALYETWRNVSISSVDNLQSTHWVSDTTYASSQSAIRRFDRYVYSEDTRKEMLTPGMTIMNDGCTVCVALNNDTADVIERCDILLVMDDVEPYKTSSRCVAISSMAEYAEEWVDYCNRNNVAHYVLSEAPIMIDY